MGVGEACNSHKSCDAWTSVQQLITNGINEFTNL